MFEFFCNRQEKWKRKWNIYKIMFAGSFANGGNEMNSKAMYNLSYGLFVLSARQDGKDNGCIINTAGQVTTE